MSAETEAYAALKNDSAVAAIVGSRIYPDFVPQDKTLPAISLTVTDTDPVTTIHSNTPVGYHVTMEAWCLSSSRASAEDLATKAVAALAGAGFVITNRVPEYDPEAEVWATVVTVMFWQ